MCLMGNVFNILQLAAKSTSNCNISNNNEVSIKLDYAKPRTLLCVLERFLFLETPYSIMAYHPS